MSLLIEPVSIAALQLRISVLERALELAIDRQLATVTEAIAAAEAEHRRDERLSSSARML